MPLTELTTLDDARLRVFSSMTDSSFVTPSNWWAFALPQAA